MDQRVNVRPGQLIWLDVIDTVGAEQAGRRPWLVVSSQVFLDHTASLVTAIPCTTRDRGWTHHVELTGPTGLNAPTFAMTEQVRTLSRERIVAVSGMVDAGCRADVLQWVHDWLEPAS